MRNNSERNPRKVAIGFYVWYLLRNVGRSAFSPRVVGLEGQLEAMHHAASEQVEPRSELGRSVHGTHGEGVTLGKSQSSCHLSNRSESCRDNDLYIGKKGKPL